VKLSLDAEGKEVVEQLDLGIVQAGESKTFEFYVNNDSNAELKDLTYSANHREIELISAPKELKPGAREKFVLKWSPSVTLKEALKASIHIEGKEIYR
jgi:hypothetical protein